MSVAFKLDTRVSSIKDPIEAVEEYIIDTRKKVRVFIILDPALQIAGRIVQSWEFIPWTIGHPSAPEVHPGDFMPIRGCMARASIELDVVDHDPINVTVEVWDNPKDPTDTALMYALLEARPGIEAITNMAFPDRDDPRSWDEIRAQWVEWFEGAEYSVIEAL